jgi:hypothetical protein
MQKRPRPTVKIIRRRPVATLLEALSIGGRAFLLPVNNHRIPQLGIIFGVSIKIINIILILMWITLLVSLDHPLV